MGYHFGEFCRVLSLRITGDTITPLHFLLAFELLCTDMDNGNGIDIRGVGEPIRSSISGCALGPVMRIARRAIVEHTFPKDFADQVMKEYNEVMADCAFVAGLR
jgi:hypothetical protein